MMQISIVGCGWLGQPLAQQLMQSGHHIVATCRTATKQLQLQQLGLNAQRFNLGDSLVSVAMRKVLSADLLIINIPPGGKHIEPEFFTEQMCLLVKTARLSGTQKLLFISTTAVYGDAQGEITEQSPARPTTLSGKAHLNIEHCVRDVFGDSACILRLAGLVGQGRHPAQYLAAKTALANPLHKVNLIHQQDVITAIKRIAEQQCFGDILHLSTHQHPSREEYYQWACGQLGLSTPTFVHTTDDTVGKHINAHWSCHILGLQLSYASPYDML